MAKRASGSAARDRARAAKAALDAKRAERDRQIEDATTRYYQADETLGEAREAMERAEAARIEALVGLLDLGESAANIEALTGCTSADVSAARRLRKADGASSASETTPSDDAATHHA